MLFSILFRACYLEIYNEKVIDLLEAKDNKNITKKIEIQKDGLHITPLKAIVCQNAQMVQSKTLLCYVPIFLNYFSYFQVLDLMKIGEKNRSIGETNMNERSSRSHTIFRIVRILNDHNRVQLHCNTILPIAQLQCILKYFIRLNVFNVVTNTFLNFSYIF